MGRKENIENLQNALIECIKQLKTEKSNESTNRRGLPNPNDTQLNQKYVSENFELITWFIISKQNTV